MRLNRTRTPLYLRPLAEISAADATPEEAAHLRRMFPSLVRAAHSGEPVERMLRHVREQVAILDAAEVEATGSVAGEPNRDGARRPVA